MIQLQRYLTRWKPLSWLLLTVLVGILTLLPLRFPTFVEPGLTQAVPSDAAIAASNNANLSTVMKFYEAYNDRSKIGLLDEIFAEDYIGFVNGRKIPGVKASRGFITAFLDAFPDANYVIEDTIIAGDRIVTRWDCTATHRGKFLGIDPTNQPIEITGITIFKLANGKIVRLWNNWDTFGLMQQLRSAG